MIKMQEISKNVKKYRSLRGLTQAQLAEMADISTIHMSHIETGTVSMSLECLLKICEALEISPNHLLLSDFVVDQDNSLLKEKLNGLTPGEKLLVYRMIDLLKELRINQP
ncbi:MAG: helix-turn-helix domain-containing protein [Blautia sp.]|jgi:transcriptional regulator with XRE-family HTH domain